MSKKPAELALGLEPLTWRWCAPCGRAGIASSCISKRGQPRWRTCSRYLIAPSKHNEGETDALAPLLDPRQTSGSPPLAQQLSHRPLASPKWPMVRVDAPVPAKTSASTRSHTCRDQCKETASRFLGQCQHTDWIGLWWAMLGLPTGTDGVSSQWQRVEATPLRAKVPPLAHPTLTPQPIKSPLRYPGISDRHLNRPMPQPFLYRP